MSTPERLIHYSAQPLRKATSIPLCKQQDHFKPKGLWVSVEGPDDWKSWCEAESFSPGNLRYEQQIVLSETANIRRLSNALEIDELTERYAFPGQRHCRYRMDWKQIADGYDGIIIAPYIWSRRLDGGADWYYSWDCASGCIWNAAAIKEIIPLTLCEMAASEVA